MTGLSCFGRCSPKKEELSARELDRLAGRTEGHCAIIESRPKARLTTETVASYARVLGVSVDWLVTGDGDPPSERRVRAAVAAAREQALRRTGTDS